MGLNPGASPQVWSGQRVVGGELCYTLTRVHTLWINISNINNCSMQTEAFVTVHQYCGYLHVAPGGLAIAQMFAPTVCVGNRYAASAVHQNKDLVTGLLEYISPVQGSTFEGLWKWRMINYISFNKTIYTWARAFDKSLMDIRYSCPAAYIYNSPATAIITWHRCERWRIGSSVSNGSGLGLEPEPNRGNGFTTWKTLTVGIWAGYHLKTRTFQAQISRSN